MKKLICEICGKEFIAYGKQAEIRRRCSTACYAIHLKRTVIPENVWNYDTTIPIVPCDTCGKLIRLGRGKSKKTNIANHFCSRGCYYIFRSKEYRGDKHPNWRGGISYHRGPKWKFLRDKIRKRANYVCQACGIHESKLKEHLHAHHVIPYDCFNSPKQANKPSNLIALCRSCHMKADRYLFDLPRFIPLSFFAGSRDHC